jgi:hypothetical protein
MRSPGSGACSTGTSEVVTRDLRCGHPGPMLWSPGTSVVVTSDHRASNSQQCCSRLAALALAIRSCGTPNSQWWHPRSRARHRRFATLVVAPRCPHRHGGGRSRHPRGVGRFRAWPPHRGSPTPALEYRTSGQDIHATGAAIGLLHDRLGTPWRTELEDGRTFIELLSRAIDGSHDWTSPTSARW